MVSLPLHPSSEEPNLKLNPWWVTGLVDGEGSLMISIAIDHRSKTGWRVWGCISIGLHVKDHTILEAIQKFWGAGKIYKQGDNAVQIQFLSKQEFAKVIKHFNNFPLKTKKLADFQLFEIALDLIHKKEHLTVDGLKKIIAIKASMNRGLSDKLKAAFPNVVPVDRPLVKIKKIDDPQWLAGFVSAEGCFFINIYKSKTKIGIRVQLVFKISQNSRDEELMRNLIKYLNCGNVYLIRTWCEFAVRNFSDIVNIIIPFFKKYRIIGVKAKDFEDWSLVAEMMKEKKHLTKDGLETIKKIKAGMNRERK